MGQTFKLNHIRILPKFEQTQISLEDQLELARGVLNQLGLYDAADFIKRRK